jgi:hypothetical protein
MNIELSAFEQSAFEQSGNAGEINTLQQHLMETQIRVSDIGVRIGQLREQQVRAKGDEQRFDKPIADAQHENIVAVADLQMTEQRLNALQARSTMAPPPEPLIDRSMLEKTGTGVFLLMLPIVFALARRIWVRSGPRVQSQVIDLESSPRLQRMEEAIESIAIEVERIGEAQRFATKLLTERPEPAVNRAVPAPTPIVRKTPGTITPH